MKAADDRAFGPRCAADGGFKPREGRVGSGPLALSLRGAGGIHPRRNAAQAQGLRPFAMWLSPHIHPKKSGPENLQAVFRPRLFRSTAGKRRAGSRPAVFRYVAVATYSSRKVPAGESASGFPAGIFRDDCAACRKNKKSVDNG